MWEPFSVKYYAHLENWGYQPLRKAEDLSLIPKRRYDFMDAYFDHIHSHGMQMMRASASTQVSVDYADEADAVRKMRVAAALAPILAAIADNTPVFEGETNHTPIRRLALWREVDSLRCGAVPHLFESDFGFSTYARWLLKTPPIFVTRPAAGDETGDKLRGAFDVSAEEIYGDAPLERSDVEHISSMFWPDVRLKQFVEVRPADCIPPEDIPGYVALIKGIFYSENSLSGIEEFVGVHDGEWPLSTEIVTDAIKQVQTFGFDGKVYGHTLAAWEEKVFSLARTALPEDERGYLDALEAFAADKPFWTVRQA